jgi:hypothetical protein
VTRDSLRRAVPPAVTGAVAFLVAWGFMLDAASALALGLVVTAVLLAGQRTNLAGEPWRRLLQRGSRDGERRDALELSWAMAGRDGRVSRRALRRVQEIGTHRLARHGLDVASADDEAALRTLVGQRALSTLRRDREPWPRLADVQHVVTVLERIGPGHPARDTTLPRSNPR